MADFVDALESRGSHTFHRKEALEALGVSEVAYDSAARRLAGKGRIARPRREFCVIVPIAYRSAGAPPPSWFIDDLMKFHGQPYYVALLSAAEIHGAAHQRPQEFQVMTDSPLRPTQAGRARIRFMVKRHIKRTAMTRVKTPTGYINISTAEATAFDLVCYVERAGHLSNVATVLIELAESIDAERLAGAAEAGVELSVAQRLGYMLDQFAPGPLTGPLAGWLEKQKPRPVPLRPDRPSKDVPRDPRWLVFVNEQVEPDL